MITKTNKGLSLKLSPFFFVAFFELFKSESRIENVGAGVKSRFRTDYANAALGTQFFE